MLGQNVLKFGFRKPALLKLIIDFLIKSALLEKSLPFFVMSTVSRLVPANFGALKPITSLFSWFECDYFCQ